MLPLPGSPPGRDPAPPSDETHLRSREITKFGIGVFDSEIHEIGTQHTGLRSASCSAGSIMAEEESSTMTGENMFDLQDRTEYHMSMIQGCHAHGRQASKAANIAAVAHNNTCCCGQHQ